MRSVLGVALLIVGLLMLLVILLQPGSSGGLAGFITGGSENTGKAKARGMDALLHRSTIVFAVIFAVILILFNFWG
ncbi:preprotein translocase subunit SecG [Pasteuria penetrans]|uniref:preprotein translocase subunit SecG n=1 Tax=Pasteuria penetrans TaxID=86005 RepID=UPI000FBD0F22|nr:preprotein translocase subunit SecG [Pasteuria penetrans]